MAGVEGEGCEFRAAGTRRTGAAFARAAVLVSAVAKGVPSAFSPERKQPGVRG